MSELIDFIIGADLFPNEENEFIFDEGIINKLVGDKLASRLCASDFRIYNLEGALTDEKSPIQKSGPIISASENTIKGIKALMPDLLVLSNNHILDEGQVGIEHTVSALKKNNISYIGVGKNELERRMPFIFEKNGIKVGIYNCCEHEFSVVEEGKWGANPYDPLYVFDDVSNLKKKCKFVIVLYHGGKEYFRYPSPLIMKVFHKFAECGADAVLAQHTHCIGTFEKYNNSLLVYGQGNFLFDTEVSDFVNTGLLIQLLFSSDNTMKYEFIPVCKDKNVTRIATEDEKSEILKAMENRSKVLSNNTFIANEYKKKSQEYLRGYLLNMHVGTKIDTIFIRLFLKFPKKIRGKFFKKTVNKLLATRNYFDCEAHRELMLAGLNNLLEI